jgi:hemoglobin
VRDIETRDDCERLVRAFYSRALVDPLIGWIFTDVAKLDLEAHVPVLTSFWETILLDGRSYGGGAFAPHAAIHARAPFRKAHFDRWLALWSTTVDELFAGPTAELAKAHAQRVARAFHNRLQGIDTPGDGFPATLTLAITRHGDDDAD